MIPPGLVFFLKIVVAIWDFLCSLTDFKIICSCEKCHRYFDRDCIESVDSVP